MAPGASVFAGSAVGVQVANASLRAVEIEEGVDGRRLHAGHGGDVLDDGHAEGVVLGEHTVVPVRQECAVFGRAQGYLDRLEGPDALQLASHGLGGGRLVVLAQRHYLTQIEGGEGAADCLQLVVVGQKETRRAVVPLLVEHELLG